MQHFLHESAVRPHEVAPDGERQGQAAPKFDWAVLLLELLLDSSSSSAISALGSALSNDEPGVSGAPCEIERKVEVERETDARLLSHSDIASECFMQLLTVQERLRGIA